MRQKRGRNLVVYWVLLLATGLAAQALLIANHHTWAVPTDPVGVGTVFAITYGTAGTAILYRRPGNAVGRVFIYISTAAVLAQLSGEYSVFAYSAPGSPLPLREFAAWISGWSFFLAFPAGLTMVFLVFPDGLRAGRWPRAIFTAALLANVALLVSFLLAAGPVSPSDRVETTLLRVSNPTGVLSPDLASSIQAAAWGLSGLALIASVGSALARLRRARGERRQQMRWLAYVAAPVAPAFALHFLVLGAALPIPDIGFPVYYLVYLAGIPLATAIALLRYRLYDLDVVISRTVVYASLAVFISTVYVGIAVGIGSLIGGGGKPNLGLSILATAIVAVGFQPVRERVQRVGNRLVYGTRATPYEVLSQFSERVAESYASEDVLPRMARVLGEGTAAEVAEVWLRGGDALHRAAVFPADGAMPSSVQLNGAALAIPGADRSVVVRHQGEVLGALTLTKRRGEQITPIEVKLMDDLAHQAGLVLKNVGLTADLKARLVDLRASRQRLVAAQDDERRRLERNLHDGAQQHLVAIKVKLGLAEMLMARDPQKVAATLEQLKHDADEALETLRDLARGIYPPLLAETGLVTALQAQARKATLPVTIETNGIGRYPQDTEAALYFCTLEALQNIQKYAEASCAVVRLREDGGRLTVEVVDDGRGFDVAITGRGNGLTNMEDRLDALGGSLQIVSSPGNGTTVRAATPLSHAVPIDI
jgi:signal transduction histidine kinase